MININLPFTFAEINILAMGFDAEQIRKALEKARKERKYRQEEVAEIIGVSPQQYGNLERGTSEFSLPQFLKVLDFFELSWIDFALLVEPNLNISEIELMAIKSIRDFADQKIQELENKNIN